MKIFAKTKISAAQQRGPACGARDLSRFNSGLQTERGIISHLTLVRTLKRNEFRAPIGGVTSAFAFFLSLFLLSCIGCASTRQQTRAGLLEPLRPYVNEVVNELDKVSAERRPVLDEIAADISAQLKADKKAKLTFICTHNSRRSHMSQIWAQTAAYHYGIDKVHAYSGGTKVTACNCRTITAMRRVGFRIKDATAGDNPLYLVSYADDRPPIRTYSKLYNSGGNPRSDFIALMTCSAADKTCPLIRGATARHAIHYADPRLCDDTPTETTAYNQRCREIAREMFYIMSQVKKSLGTHPQGIASK